MQFITHACPVCGSLNDIILAHNERVIYTCVGCRKTAYFSETVRYDKVETGINGEINERV
jgi:hypothetical protein